MFWRLTIIFFDNWINFQHWYLIVLKSYFWNIHNINAEIETIANKIEIINTKSGKTALEKIDLSFHSITVKSRTKMRKFSFLLFFPDFNVTWYIHPVRQKNTVLIWIKWQSNIVAKVKDCMINLRKCQLKTKGIKTCLVYATIFQICKSKSNIMIHHSWLKTALRYS